MVVERLGQARNRWLPESEYTHDDATPARHGPPTEQAAQRSARRPPINPQPAPTESGV